MDLRACEDIPRSDTGQERCYWEESIFIFPVLFGSLFVAVAFMIQMWMNYIARTHAAGILFHVKVRPPLRAARPLAVAANPLSSHEPPTCRIVVPPQIWLMFASPALCLLGFAYMVYEKITLMEASKNGKYGDNVYAIDDKYVDYDDPQYEDDYRGADKMVRHAKHGRFVSPSLLGLLTPPPSHPTHPITSPSD